MRMVRFLATAWLAFGFATAGSRDAGAQALQSFSGGSLFATFQADGDTVGWKFSTSLRFVVTHLGYWDGDASLMVGPHPVALWGAGGQVFDTLVVLADSPLTSGWRYEPAYSFVLPVGTHHLGAFVGASNPLSDGYMSATTNPVMATGFTMLATLRDPDGAQSGLVFPTVESAIGGRYGPNLLFATPAPAIEIEMGVTSDGRTYTCGTEGSVALPAGSDVFACYSILNVGNATLTRHDLSDSRLGPLLDDFSFWLVPSASAYLTQITHAPAGGVWTSDWSAYNPGPFEVSAAADEIKVVPTPPLLSCNGPTVTFSSGIPPGITSFDGLAWPGGDSEPDFWDLAGCGEAENWTGARGGVACASSEQASPGEYNTQLRTHAMNLSGQTSAAIGFTLNYQNADEELWLESSINNGATWQPYAFFNGSFGVYHVVGGTRVVVGLAPLAGQPSLRLRWRYENAALDASDLYVQIDNIALTCGDGIFFDGFESADDHAWSSAIE